MPTPIRSLLAAAPLAAAAIALAACPRTDTVRCEQPRPARPDADPSPSPPAPRDALGAFAETLARPAPLPPEQLERAVARLSEDLDLEAIPKAPAVGEPAAPIIDEQPDYPFIDWHRVDYLVLGSEPERGAEAERVRAHPRLLLREPTARMDEHGKVTVSFETVRSVPAGSLYYGAIAPEDPFGLARLRKQERAMGSTGDGRQHTLSFEARTLLRGKYDIGGVRARGRGRLVWRVEVLDPEEGSSRVFDGQTAFRCEPTPCTEDARFVQLPSLRLGPFVDRVRPRAAVVSFETDAATHGAVLVVDEGGEVRRFDAEEPGTEHEVSLEGLSPSTRHRYYAVAIDGRGEHVLGRGATFRTAPVDEEHAFTFVALSDSRSGHGSADERYAGTNRRVLRRLLFEALRTEPELVMFVGDLVDGYTTEPGSFRFELEAWKRAVQPVAQYVPVYEGMGNHEALLELWDVGWALDRSGAESAEAIFASEMVSPDNGPEAADGAPPYDETVYSFDWGPAHMAVLNSNYWFRSHYHREDHPRHPQGEREGWLDDRQLEWLEQDLQQAREAGAKHLLVYTHEPAFPNGGHVHDGMWWNGRFPEVLEQRARFIRILSRHGVAVLFHGDEHNYSRTRIDGGLVEGVEQPIWQIVSGGAGAPYYARNREVPWADHVAAFDTRQHFVAFHVDGETLEVRTVALTGETIDLFEATGPR